MVFVRSLRPNIFRSLEISNFIGLSFKKKVVSQNKEELRLQ